MKGFFSNAIGKYHIHVPIQNKPKNVYGLYIFYFVNHCYDGYHIRQVSPHLSKPMVMTHLPSLQAW